MSYNIMVPGDVDLVGTPDRFESEDNIYAASRAIRWISASHGEEAVEKNRWADRLFKQFFTNLNSEIPVRGTGANGRPYIWGDNTDPSCAFLSPAGTAPMTGNLTIACFGKNGTAATATLWSIVGAALNQDISLRYRHDNLAQLAIGGTVFKQIAAAVGNAFFEVGFVRATSLWTLYFNGAAQLPHVTQAWTQESDVLALLACVNTSLAGQIRASARSTGLYEVFLLDGAIGTDLPSTYRTFMHQLINDFYGTSLPV